MLFQLLSTNPLFILPWLLTILLAIGVHEFCHALSAYLQGDDTAQNQGRLTLNPLAHVDWLGLILLVTVGFGWGKPTPYNPYNLKFKKWGGALVGLAGPISNLLMASLAALVFKVLGYSLLDYSASTNLLSVFLQFMMEVNVSLFVFNLIPLPPLDGSKILYSFLGLKHQDFIAKLEFYGPFILIGLLVLGDGILSTIMLYISAAFYSLFALI